MRSAWLRRLAIAAIALLPAANARAEDCHPKGGLSTCVDADNLWPHPGGGQFFALGSTTTTPSGKVAFGLVGTYLARPIGLGVASPDPAGARVFVVDHLVDASLLFALGITNRLELTMAA